MPTKQVIVVRTVYPDGKGGTFKPRTGKLIAQACHASIKVLLDAGDTLPQTAPPYSEPAEFRAVLWPAAEQWISGAFTKIALACKSGVEAESELRELQAKADALGLHTALITDSGATEFHGVPTVTAMAIGPDEASQIDAVTGHLGLL